MGFADGHCPRLIGDRSADDRSQREGSGREPPAIVVPIAGAMIAVAAMATPIDGVTPALETITPEVPKITPELATVASPPAVLNLDDIRPYFRRLRNEYRC